MTETELYDGLANAIIAAVDDPTFKDTWIKYKEGHDNGIFDKKEAKHISDILKKNNIELQVSRATNAIKDNTGWHLMTYKLFKNNELIYEA